MAFMKKRTLRKAMAVISAFVMTVALAIPSGGFGFGATAYAADYTTIGSTKSADGDYFYDFREGKIITGAGTADINYETLTVKAGATNSYKLNGNQHGAEFNAGNSVSIAVTGPTRVSVGDCQYSNATSLTLTSADGTYSQTVDCKKGCYHNDGSAVVFNYQGTAATTLTMTFTAKTYVPGIRVESLNKTYSFTNGTILPQDNKITYNTALTYGSMTIQPGTGTFYFNDSTHGAAFNAATSVQFNVNGATKVTVGQCTYSGVTSMTLSNADKTYTETQNVVKGCSDVLEFRYNGADPTTLTLTITGSGTAYVPFISTSAIFEEVGDVNGAVKDTVASYNFSNGSVVPTTYDSANKLTGSLTSADNMLTVTGAGDLYWHDKQHGLALYNGNTFAIKVAGDATITFNQCQYGADPAAKIVASTKKGKIISEKSQLLKGSENDGLSQVSFTYSGVATTILFTISAVAGTENYLHGINVSNLPAATDVPALVGNGKVDVWDFGAAELDSAAYNNKLTTSVINSWYPSGTVAGSEGNTIGSFETADICFNAAGYVNNRIRTSNTAITRYDVRTDVTIDSAVLSGYVYSNNTTAGIFLGVKAYKNDILRVYAGSNGGSSTIYCQAPSGKIQTAVTDGNGKLLTFSANEYGMYKFFSADEKLVIYRVEREHTQPVLVSGNVDISAASAITSKDYRILFTNQETGEVIESEVVSGKYSAYLNQQFHYSVTLKNANGFVIKSANTVNLAKGSGTTAAFDITIAAVDLVTMTGEINGLSPDALAKLKLAFVNTDKIYVPDFSISGTTITAYLERGVEYKLAAYNINDYFFSDITTVMKTDNATQNITFALKPTYDVNLTLENLPSAAVATATVTFTNINEAGYKYTFNLADIATTPVKLRDGQYKAVVKGTGSVPYIQALTSDVKVNGAAVNKTIKFVANTSWDFSKYNANPGIETIGTDKYYLGLKVSPVTVLENKVYLLVQSTGTVDIPVKAGDLLTLSYCYAASFSVSNVKETVNTVTCTSGSTTQIDSTQFTAAADGVVTITGTGTSYLTSIVASQPVAYAAKVTVGTDKQFKTINAALENVSKMARPNGERVEIVIDPGNYEEQLVVSIPNVSLVNAAGNKASIEVVNKGVDIADNAVRITSYYGHGYNYYSMTTNCKYNSDVLAVNQENGYLTVTNPGSGTTNNSYWNATVTVTGSGFKADGIIFENSFNQYISAKEAADTVVMWASGSKGLRPVTAGDTSVQNKSFVERAAAIAITGDKSVFTGCKFIGRQDTLYGGSNVKSLFEKCDILGATDYIFGGITAVFYQCNLVMNTDNKATSDVTYITAAQQSSGRGYLMYNCNITSTTPGIDTASTTRSQAGYFGRPWAANTSEVVFYKTTVQTTDYSGTEGSILAPLGWIDTLGGQSLKMYEYGTMEAAGIDNTASRAKWSTVLTTPVLSDSTPISVAAFLGDWTTELQASNLAIELADSALTTVATVTGTEEERLVAYSQLTEAVKTAEAVNGAYYPVASYSAVTSAVTAAKALKVTSAVTSLRSALTAVNNAVSALVMSNADYSVLNTAVAKAEALDRTVYSADSLAKADTALAAAKAVEAGLKVDSQAKVDSAAAALNTALNELVKVIITANNTDNSKITDNNAVIPSGAKFTVEAVTSGSVYQNAAAVVAAQAAAGSGITQFAVFEMNLKDASNVAISQLTGKISVTIPVPSNLDATKTIAVFRVESNGTLTKLDTKIIDGNCVFETDHFSTYVVAQLADAVTQTPVIVQTSDSTNFVMYTLILLLSVISGVSVIFGRKRKEI